MHDAHSRPDSPIATETVTSHDGTIIGYRALGQGPGLLIVHGGAGRSEYFLPLAQLLADRYTVYVMDRRGRGLSGLQGADYHIEQEYADVIALVEQTSIPYVFGHSYGGTVALGAALTRLLPKLALYEPGLSEPLRVTLHALQAALPQAHTLILPNQGHSAPTTAPELVAPLLQAFFV